MRGTRSLLIGGVLVLASLSAPTGTALAAGNGSASPARAADATQSFRNQATGRCMDDTDDGFRTWSCNGSNPQLWDVKVWDDGTRQLRNVNTGRCVEDSDNGFRTVGTCGSTPEQSWWIKVWDDGTVRFQNQATLRCIDDSSLGFRTWPCNDAPYQSWF
ncbi:RICIN domain-containing protein [Streptomyces sp. NBC_00893]|uniref:RICIN domain-containing protein n=1 Tax=Streptomyces sp. NBC_00893 TaxID=2975862 RepID=UPI002250E11F|nr:RICIN domain-containing protein [Streptomyces sp. NBC_00893]MCX4846451.1 RICIN domain-containing protein [Streptomyces sp. NBC_00893]